MRYTSWIILTAFTLTGCASLARQSETRKSESKPVAGTGRDSARDPKPIAEPAPFLVEAFRCSMQPSPRLSVGIRIYSSIDGKETTLIYGPDRMDTPPIENDSFLYNGVKVSLAGNADGRTQYTFQHPKISLQIAIPRSSSKTDVFESVYSEETGAKGVKGACTRVSSVTY